MRWIHWGVIWAKGHKKGDQKNGDRNKKPSLFRTISVLSCPKSGVPSGCD